jgi:hypothetical protein
MPDVRGSLFRKNAAIWLILLDLSCPANYLHALPTVQNWVYFPSDGKPSVAILMAETLGFILIAKEI